MKLLIQVAADDKSPEYEELHQFLLQVFAESNTDFDGLISSREFDVNVERKGCGSD